MLFMATGEKERGILNRISIRVFKDVDIDFAYEMVRAEQWNDRKEGIKRMLDYEQEGCFIAETNGERVGHVFSVSYGKLGWIGLLIVRAEYRRDGVGTMLMKKAIAYLLSRGVETAKLEAVLEIVDLYRKMGFVDEYDSLRFVGKSRKDLSKQNERIQPMENEMIADIARFDSRYFGADRSKVVSRLFREYPEYCFVSRSGSTIDGYVMCRKADAGYKLGPLVCDPMDPNIAKKLLVICMSTMEQDEGVYIGVPAPNKAAIKILIELGFEQYSKSVRMRRGKETANDDARGVFAIGGPMKG